MMNKYNSAWYLVWLLLGILQANHSTAQDSLVLKEIQTFYLDGTIKSIDKEIRDENFNLIQSSTYDFTDNTLYNHFREYDSLNRCTKEWRVDNNKLMNNSLYEYSKAGFKKKVEWFYDFQTKEMSEKWVTIYDKQNRPTNIFSYDITYYQNGDTTSTLVSESRKYYNDKDQLIIDSTFSGISGRSNAIRIVNGKYEIPKKINPATVIQYTYNGVYLVTESTVDEYGNTFLIRHTRNKDGDYIKHEQISVVENDTNSIVTNYSYKKSKGKKIETSSDGNNNGFYETHFDKKGNHVFSASYDMNGVMMSKTEYKYNKKGYLIEQIYSYLYGIKPINIMDSGPLGYKSVYIYDKYQTNPELKNNLAE